MEFDPALVFAIAIGLTTGLGCVLLFSEIRWKRKIEQRLLVLETKSVVEPEAEPVSEPEPEVEASGVEASDEGR